jgi:MFS family permease
VSVTENAGEQAPGRVYYGHYLAAFSFFLGFASGAMYLYSRGVLVREQIVDFSASRVEISFAFATVEAVSTAFAPVLGFLLDRYPIRNVMVWGAAWLGAGFIAMSQVSTILQFTVVTALFVGLGTGGIGTATCARLMVSWYDRHRGLALAVAATGYSVAGVVMAPVAVYLLEKYGWRFSYILFGCICLLLILPAVALLVKQRQGDFANNGSSEAAVSEQNWTHRLAAYQTFARSPQFWTVVLVFGLMAGVFSGLNLHLFLHYMDLGLSDYQAATVLSVTAGLAIVSKPLFGWLSDRWSARCATVVATCGCILTMLCFAVASHYKWLLLAGALFGLTFGSLLPLRAALLSRLFDTAEFGRAYGSLRFAIAPLSMACTAIIGLIYDFRGSYTPVFAVFAVLFCATAVAAHQLRPKEQAQDLQHRF